ncbi:hypothetical protein MNBD_BACTEROID07-936 [hydrothermal vent metagenome]|uniref:Outer membrane protein beta-barrel domain-containing protein n=1 Tax=hydrothermal vent metagenome TaxID=652676 RepID=A0A3B0ULU8_9ZZZZ
MIKKTLLLGMIFLFPLVSVAQQKPLTKQKISFYLKFGGGLYLDIGNGWSNYYADRDAPTVNGQQIWIEGGIRLNDGLVITAGVMHVTLDRRVGLSNYSGWQIQYNIRNYAFGLGYEFKLGKHSRLMPELAFAVHWSKVLRVYYFGKYDNSGDLTLNSEIYNEKETKAGAVFNLDYYYQFKNRLFVGLRSGVYYVSGMEGITLTPLLGVKF